MSDMEEEDQKTLADTVRKLSRQGNLAPLILQSSGI